MEEVKVFDWHRIFLGNENDYLFMAEIGFRVVFIYVFAVVLLRFMGKRGNRSLSIFENVLIIALGSATGDALFYPKVPLLYACIVIAIIVLCTRILQNLQYHSLALNTFLDGSPVLMVEQGKVIQEGLKATRVREDELYGMLREGGISNTNEVVTAYFERSGQLSIKKAENQLEVIGVDLFEYVANR